MDCCSSLIKYLLFSFNFIFVFSGIGLIVAGACVLKDVNDYNIFLWDSVAAPPIVFIIVGIIVFVISFLGCCGAIKENFYMLVGFAFLLLVLFIMQITVGAIAAISKESFADHLKKSMLQSQENFSKDPGDRLLWTKVQNRFECCGVDGPSDWKLGNLYPRSCCKNGQKEPPEAMCGPTKEHLYKEGCYEKLKTKISECFVIIAGVGIAFALLELAGIFLACLLALAIRKQKKRKAEEE